MSKHSEHTGSSAGSAFEKLVDLMATLRSPSGCAWDREQTLKSLRPYLIEETYEVIDAIDRNDLTSLKNELGDFLLEAVFVAQICSEQNSFHIGDAIEAVCEKLIRRHPHVFERNAKDEDSLTSAEVKQQWEIIKANERTDQKHRTGSLSGLPSHLPSLLHADRIGRRASVVGFDWQSLDDVDTKVAEEFEELDRARTEGNAAAIEEELGDLLFSVANLARHLKVEPESALRAANHKFTERFTELEESFKKQGIALRDASIEAMEAEWQRIKLATSKT
ncbi:nucleoside triphosphate pyrophosphohydrolase [bacterium]|nr:MAG: nucleoside triphosphate pyrophosphohydrolase [bacterium]